MRTWMLSGLMGALLLGSGPATAQKGKAGGRGWLTSLDAGKAQAKQTGKPLMVVFRCEP
jgi:hypothetical protein